MLAKIDIAGTLADFGKLERSIKFATVRGVTRTAYAAKAAVELEARRVFDNPSPATLRGFYVRPAKMEHPVAEVAIKDEFGGFSKGTPAIKFLRSQVYGGSRRQKRSERALARSGILGNMGFWVPGSGVKLDQHGNVPGSVMRKILSDLRSSNDGFQDRTARSAKRNKRYKRERFFLAPKKSKLPPGVYVRRGREVKAALFFVPQVMYRPRLDFFGVVERTVAKEGPAILAKSINEELRAKFGA